MTLVLKQFAYYLVILVFLIFHSKVYSQTLSVYGNVSTESTAVSYASVTFINEDDTTKKYSAITDTSGNYRLDVITVVKKEPIIPQTIGLAQNYPNPFSTETEIPYKLNKQLDVSIKIYNILGEEVKTFRIGLQTNGIYGVRWDGTNNFGNKVSPGIYFYQMQTSNETIVKKLVFTGGSPQMAMPVTGKISSFIKVFKKEEMIQPISVPYTIQIINTDSTSPRILNKEFNNVTIQSDTTLNFIVQKKEVYQDLFGSITKDESPFYINGAARVPQGKTLFIEPGVTILFNSGDVDDMSNCDFDWSDSTISIGFLRVDGKLIAEGTKSDSIIFTKNSKQENHYWGCIYFSETADSNSIISFSKVEYASLIYEIESRIIGEGITCWFSSIIIKNSLIQNFKEFGICLQNSETLVENNIIRGCITGIDTWAFDQFDYLHPVIINNIIIKNTHNGVTIGKPQTILENNVICFNKNAGLFLGFELLGRAKIANNIIYGNKNYQVKIDSFYVRDPDITYSNIEAGWTGEGNIDRDPKFVDPANENFHLLFDSPCIDTGSPLSKYNDHDGSRNDMGAYGGPYGDW